MTKYLAIDIGGTFIKYSIMNESYVVLEESEEETQKDPEQFLEQLKKIALMYKDSVEGIAACIAGFINPNTGENTDYSVGERFRKYNLKKELEQLCGLPVVLENDSNCAAIGEMVCGAAKGVSDFCLLTIGTGIGGAVVIHNDLIRGKHFKAGEAGLTLLGTKDSDGQIRGENTGATSVLVRKVSETIRKPVDGMYVFAHLADPAIWDIYQTWIYNIAIVAGNMAMILDPEVLLIGGGISHEPRFIKDLKEAVYSFYPNLIQSTKILPCCMGNRAGRIGVLYLWLKQNREENSYE